MADISVTPKKGGANNWVLALVAIVLVIGLMLWLARQEGTTAITPVVQEDTTTAVVEDTVPAAVADDTVTADQP